LIQKQTVSPIKRLLRFLVLAACAVFLPAALCQADTIQVREDMSSGRTRWVSAFDVEVSADEIMIGIDISLLLPKAVNRALFKEKVSRWEAAIESVWNDRFYASVDQVELPVKFAIRFTHFKPQHRVIVHPGDWVPNQHNWYIDTPGFVVAHEIGHMLGAYDEYNGGALSPERPVIDSTSIMGGKPSQGRAYARHLALFESKLMGKFGDSRIRIVEY
jgi:hypothetical protein